MKKAILINFIENFFDDEEEIACSFLTPGDIEVWVTPFVNNDVAVLFLNKDPFLPRKMSVPYNSINEGLKGLDESIYLQSDETYMILCHWLMFWCQRFGLMFVSCCKSGRPKKCAHAVFC